jgi:hypothetical protein
VIGNGYHDDKGLPVEDTGFLRFIDRKAIGVGRAAKLPVTIGASQYETDAVCDTSERR